MSVKSKVRALPQVNLVLELPLAADLIARHGRTVVVGAVRRATALLRTSMLAGEKIPADACEPQSVLAAASGMIDSDRLPRLRRAVNATGIVLHTGLGRAAMPRVARDAVTAVMGACNIQLDLETGKRSRRESCLGGLVAELTGAQDALVVNNNAGATLLVLRALASGKEVVVSRGELIEIGGSFRLPDVMKESGAILREVGTTNKTHLRDYERAVNKTTGLLLKAHKSNFKIVGFTREVGIAEIAAVGKKRRIPVVDDLGAGAMMGLEQFGLEHEMTIRESLAAGADIVLASTDKLIGGPQGGLIVGRKKLIEIIRSHPLYRALRVDKMTLAALEATLKLFRAPELLADQHPVYAMLAKSPEAVRKQADTLAVAIGKARPDWKVDVRPATSALGGGSLPGSELPSFAVAIVGRSLSAEEIARGLRVAAVPVVSRISGNAVLLDMRTVSPGETDDILDACRVG